MKKITLFSLFVICVISACRKDTTLNANLDAIDRNVVAATSVDNWLTDNYLNIYNIEVKYRWDPYEADVDKTLVPPYESQVIPTMETVRDLWIRPYEKVGGANFMKFNTPKQFYLVGSPSFNGDGTITLGTAEGGRKVLIYVVNDFSKADVEATEQMVHVIQHEFTHILNQKVAFKSSFGLITKSDYTANWNIPSLAVARSLGFITQYARASDIEDFAEMTSIMLQYGKRKYDAIVNALPADPKAKLRKKEQFVVEYFKTAWNIDFYKLQNEVTIAAIRNAPPKPLPTIIGPDKTYTKFLVTPAATTSTPQSPQFLAAWNDAVAKMKVSFPVSYDLIDMIFTFQEASKVTVRYTVKPTIPDPNVSVLYIDADYTMQFDTNNDISLTFITPQPTTNSYINWTFTQSVMKSVNDYIINKKFKIDYAPTAVPDDKGLPGALGVFSIVSNPTSYMVGVLN